MNEAYEKIKESLRKFPRTWLVTGAAGFIGSHLVENLLALGQTVTGLDNFATGSQKNIDDVLSKAEPENAARFQMITGDIRDPETCRKACKGKEMVLHQAALGSVPRSLQDPLSTYSVNADGFFNMILAARDAGVQSFVYASSSSIYGDEPNLPKREDRIGNPLSPYALTKLHDEQMARVFARCYGFRSIGLRYFNVFGPRQDPNGPYAAAIPRWFEALSKGRQPLIYGDGETSRDFCYVANVVQANLLAATASNENAWDRAYNVACGSRTTLNELVALIRNEVSKENPGAETIEPKYEDFRKGDIRHSLADITQGQKLLGYEPQFFVRDGLKHAAEWYLNNEKNQ
jgi:UDP-N-acetylglucosamine 4-epimerase